MRTNIESISLTLTEPMIMTIDKVELNKLNLVCGYNGSGKSLVLINLWAINYLVQCYVISNSMNLSLDIVSRAQFIYENCFTQFNQTGIVSGYYWGGFHITVTMVSGKITNVDVSTLSTITEVNNINYQTTNLRLFSNMKIYLKLRTISMKSHNVVVVSDNVVMDLLKDYRLYEITSMELLLMRLPIVLPENVSDNLVKSFSVKDKVISLALNDTKDSFMVTLADGSIKDVSTYSNGDQSLLNLIITNH